MGEAPSILQNHQEATYKPRRTPEDGAIDWSWPAMRIYNLIRGVTRPYPGAFTFWQGKKLTLWASVAVMEDGRKGHVAGEVIEVRGKGIVVSTGQGTVVLGKVGLGKEDMNSVEFEKWGVSVGQRFDDEELEGA